MSFTKIKKNKIKNLMPDLINLLDLSIFKMELQNNTNQLETVVETIVNYIEEDETH